LTNFASDLSLFFGTGGGGLDLRFNLSRRARCALRPGDGPRTVGFFMSILRIVDLRLYSRNWRDPSSSAKFYQMVSETIELRGHIIDSLTLPKVLDQIVTRGATFNIVEFKIGQKRVDQSCARIEISAPSSSELNDLIERLREQGAEVSRPEPGTE